jgi:hypothetical protein
MTFRRRLPRQLKYIRDIEFGTSVPLSNGQVLDLSFSIEPFRKESPEERYVYPHMVVRNRFQSIRGAWTKEGKPTGPGGTEVFTVMDNLWGEGEQYALSVTKHPLTMWVTGATPELFSIYRWFLSRRGYRLSTVEDAMYSYLR